MPGVHLLSLIVLSSILLAVPCQSQITSHAAASQPPLGSEGPTSHPIEPVYMGTTFIPPSNQSSHSPPIGYENSNIFAESPESFETAEEDPYSYGEGPAAGPAALPSNYYYDGYQKVRDSVAPAAIIGIIIGGVVLSLLLVGCVCICRARQRNIQRARYGNTGAGVGSVEIF